MCAINAAVAETDGAVTLRYTELGARGARLCILTISLELSCSGPAIRRSVSGVNPEPQGPIWQNGVMPLPLSRLLRVGHSFKVLAKQQITNESYNYYWRGWQLDQCLGIKS